MYSNCPSVVSSIILSWLEKRSPDKTVLCRSGSFPECERLHFAALLHHSPRECIQEGKDILDKCQVLERLKKSIGIEPSEAMMSIWKLVLNLRHWLVKSRQVFRARLHSEDEETPDLQIPTYLHDEKVWNTLFSFLTSA